MECRSYLRHQYGLLAEGESLHSQLVLIPGHRVEWQLVLDLLALVELMPFDFFLYEAAFTVEILASGGSHLFQV